MSGYEKKCEHPRVRINTIWDLAGEIKCLECRNEIIYIVTNGKENNEDG